MAGIKKLAAGAACLLSVTGLVLIGRVANGTDTEVGYLGGLDWDLLIFNWHPLLMSSFVTCAILSALTWMLSPFNHAVTKLVHGGLHTVGAVCLSLGLYCVLKAHSGQNQSHTPYANLATIHSWVGLAAIVLYLGNFLMGLLHFVASVCSDDRRKNYLPSHRTVGMITFFVAVTALIAGIMETIPCDYTVTEYDANPAAHYHDLSIGCRLGNGAGIAFIAAVVCAGFALMSGEKVEHREQDDSAHKDGFDEYLLNR